VAGWTELITKEVSFVHGHGYFAYGGIWEYAGLDGRGSPGDGRGVGEGADGIDMKFTKCYSVAAGTAGR